MSNYFSEEFIEKVRSSNDIFDVVSEYVSLEKKGKYYFGLCPFHNEKTPSFSVTPDMQIFNCFGCSKGGNVIHFIMNIENLDFPEAVKLLAERANIEIPENSRQNDDKLQALRKEVLKLNKSAALYFYKNLMSYDGSKALNYLVDRGIKPGMIRKFGLGYSLPQRDSLSEFIMSGGFKKDAIEASGLFLKKDENDFYDRFKNRIMFPIFDLRNNVLGFGARSIDNSMPKYINSPETIIYTKGNNVYSLNFAKNENKETLIITEGYFDVISMHQNGFPNTVAALGTALTVNQAKLLKRYSKEIYICFDSDAAGKNAALRSLDILDSIGGKVKVVSLPDGKDPDDFFKKHQSVEFNNVLDEALSLVDYKIHLLEQSIDTSTTEGKLEFIRGVSKVLAALDSRVEVELYAQKYAKIYNVSVQAFFSEIINNRNDDNEQNKRVYKSRENNIKVEKNDDSNIDLKEKISYNELFLIAILCKYEGLYDAIKDNFDLNLLSDKNRKLMDIFINKYDSHEMPQESEMMNFMDDEDASKFSKILANECNFEDYKNAFYDLLKRTNHMKLELKKKEILQDIKMNKGTKGSKGDELIKELNRLIFEIKKKY